MTNYIHQPFDTSSDQHRVVLLFDGTCGICTRCARWLRERDPDGKILTVPSQSAGWRARFSVTPEDAARRVYAIDATGRKFAGAAAINRALEELGGTAATIGKLYRFPPIALIENALYPLIARYRYLLSRWGDPPACDDPNAGCQDSSAIVANL